MERRSSMSLEAESSGWRDDVDVQRTLRREDVLRIKVITMGDKGVGKSSILKRFCEDKFVNKYMETIGVDYGVKELKPLPHKAVRVNLWDLAGGNEYYLCRNEFYKDAQGAILCYDPSNRASFDRLDSWMSEAELHGFCSRSIVVCATKADLRARTTSIDGPIVSTSEGKDWARLRGLQHFDVSAATGSSIKAMFWLMLSLVLDAAPGVEEVVAEKTADLAAEEIRLLGRDPPLRARTEAKNIPRLRRTHSSEGARPKIKENNFNNKDFRRTGSSYSPKRELRELRERRSSAFA